MISFLVDQNFNERIVDGLTRRIRELDLVLARHLGLAEEPDSAILEWAATRNWILLTHDRRTIPPLAYARVAAGQAMPGVFLVSDAMPIGQAIDELTLAVQCLSREECDNRVIYFPL